MTHNKIITISREYASGGRTIAKKIAKRLGIPCYDTSIIRETMVKTGLNEQLILSTEQRVTNSYHFSLAMGIDPSRNYIQKIHNAEQEIILEKIQQGPCVIVGRSANFILNERINALQVFIYSDEETRVKYAMEHYGQTQKDAISTILQSDRERMLYSKNFYNKDWGLRTNYDIMLNSAMLGIDGCVEQVLKACEVFDTRIMEVSTHE